MKYVTGVASWLTINCLPTTWGCAGLTSLPAPVPHRTQDAIVQMLDRDLEEAEEQYGLAVRGHMMIMDSLLDLQYQRMKALEAQFNSDLKALEDEFEA